VQSATPGLKTQPGAPNVLGLYDEILLSVRQQALAASRQNRRRSEIQPSRTGGFRATSVTASKSLLDRIVLPKPLHRFGKCLSGDAAITMAGILCKIKMVMIALALEH
jgi:hypothetical protein